MSHAGSSGLHSARIPETECCMRTRRGEMVAADATVAQTGSQLLLYSCTGSIFSATADKLSSHALRASAGVDFTCF